MVGFHGLGIFNNRKAFEIDVEQNWRKTRDLDKLDETQKGTKSKAESSEARDRKEKVLRSPRAWRGGGRLAPRRCSEERRLRLSSIFLRAERTALGRGRVYWEALTAAEVRPRSGNPFPKPGWGKSWGPVTPQIRAEDLAEL